MSIPPFLAVSDRHQQDTHHRNRARFWPVSAAVSSAQRGVRASVPDYRRGLVAWIGV
jgi:hypothetical protein